MNSSNSNMEDLVKRAQEMIKNNQIPDEVKQIMGNMASKESSTVSGSSPSPVVSNTANHSNNNIDMNALMNLVNKFNSQSTDDDMSRLLFALKPYLRNERKEKIDEYVKFVKMGKMAQLMDLFGGDKK